MTRCVRTRIPGRSAESARGRRAGWKWPSAVGDGSRPDRRRPRARFHFIRMSPLRSGDFFVFSIFAGHATKLVMVELEFPSIQYFYHEAAAARRTYRNWFPTPDQIRIDLDNIACAIDETTLSCHFTSPFPQLVYRCYASGSSSGPPRRRPTSSSMTFQATGTISSGRPEPECGFLRWVGVLSGFVAGPASLTSTCARICARNCGPR